MSRSGYCDDVEDVLQLGRWRAQVKSSIRGKRGQSFLQELAREMDAMPEKALIAGSLIDSEGSCCTIGVVCKSRGIDVSKIDVEEPHQVGEAVGIAYQLAAEIEWLNDEWSANESPEGRWARMRKWVENQIANKEQK